MIKNIESYRRMSQVPETVQVLMAAHGMPVPVSVVHADFDRRGATGLKTRLSTYIWCIRQIMHGDVTVQHKGKHVVSYALNNWDEFSATGWPLPQATRDAIRARKTEEAQFYPADVDTLVFVSNGPMPPLVSAADPLNQPVHGGARGTTDTGITLADTVGAIDVAAMNEPIAENTEAETDHGLDAAGVDVILPADDQGETGHDTSTETEEVADSKPTRRGKFTKRAA